MLPAARMSHLQVALYEGQEMNSPTASQIRMEASNPPWSLLQSPPPTLGGKRGRSSSSPESVRKRPSLLPEPAPMPEPSEPLLPEPCWGCFSTPKAPSDVASLDDEVDIDMLKSPSASLTPSDSDTTQNTSSMSSRKKRKQYFKAGIVYVGPKDEKFQAAILDPLGVFISSSRSEETKPIDIFGLQLSTPDSRAILRKSDNELEEIMQDFAEYEERGYDEHALSRICFDSVVLRDRFIDAPNTGDDQNITTSVRREKWKPKKEGPSIPIGRYTYDWDIKPGTTYGVSIRMFDVKHRRELGLKECQPWLAEYRVMVCPYLTVEYKCTVENGKASDARYQNTAASVLWLHQRKQIREALGLTLDDLKHFSITIVDSRYTISEARFQDGLYYVRALVRGFLTAMDGLKLYIEWNNAIHTWGLGANASSFKEDIERLLQRFRGQPNYPWPLRTRSPADAPQQSGVV